MNRLYERDILGSIAILLVVFGHSIAYFTWWKPNLYGLQSIELGIFFSFFSAFTMPLFVLLSGVLFKHWLNKGVYQDQKTFFKKKFRRLLVPFMVFSPIMIFVYSPYELTFASILTDLLNGPKHMWFVLILFYTFVFYHYFSNYLDKKPYTSIFILTLIAMLGKYLKWEYGEMYGLSDFLSYLIFFYLGMSIIKNNNMNLPKYQYIVYIGLYVVLWVIHRALFGHSDTLMGASILPVLEGILGALAVYWLAVNYQEIIMRICGKQIEFISRNSYGIYLFHLPIIFSLTDLFRQITPLNMYLVILIQFTVSIFLSILLTECIRKFKMSKIIIGE